VPSAPVPSAPGTPAAGGTPATGPAGSTTVSSGPSGIDAVAADLIDSTTGKRLWSRRLIHRRPIASITKVMTALMIIGAGHLEQKIRVPEAAVIYARDNDAGTAGLHAGDRLTRRQLLEALLLPSGADAAYTLAHAYRHGWKALVAKMNSTAKRLRMTNTHFANFDGLPYPSESSTYSTPHSLMILAAAAMKSATFRAIVAQSRHALAPTSQHHGYSWRNTNLLIGEYHGAIGIKTGFTSGAGYCVLFAARRGGQVLTGVVLDATSTYPNLRFTVAEHLLNWGFSRIGK
jgi:D-alanyl-D-alanine carboxypeptidase (penicillin-binding protein 5/6)